MLSDLSGLLDALTPLVRRAASLVLEVYATDFQVTDKGGNDPVTVADRNANALLTEGLAQLFPGVPVVAEESDASSYVDYTKAAEAFYVDPLDGTREFVSRNGEFVVMVGLARQGRAVAGLVMSPTTGQIWGGAEGHGAYEESSDGARRPLRLDGTVASLEEARLVVSRSRRSPALDALIQQTPPRELIAMGSAGLKATSVARGFADAYVQLDGAGCLWDACAPAAIVTAAGGRYTDAHGEAIDHRGPIALSRGIVAASPRLHEHLLRRLA